MDVIINTSKNTFGIRIKNNYDNDHVFTLSQCY